MPAPRLRDLLQKGRPLLLPCAHDALAAKLIEQAGFSAYSIGGFGVIASRLGLPDVGLASFGEVSAAVRDITSASSLPVLVDGDDGYGDVKNVTRTVQVYEAMGVAGLVLEDQTNPKRCGHMAGKSVVATEQALRKLDAALAARRDSGFLIVARTDARAVHGLDDALERGRRYLVAGVDALLVEAPQSEAELETIGGSFDAPLIANMAEAGRTPILPPQRLAAMGFSIVVYPSTLFLRSILTMQRALADLRAGAMNSPPELPSFAQLTGILGLPTWDAVDDRFGTPH
jgi:2-methylisocitrate lyase-like PEP mutase family enzyme